MRLSDAGQMVQTVWERLPNRFAFIELDQFVVMPNHLHGIIVLTEMFQRRGEYKNRPYDRPRGGQYKNSPHGTLEGTVGRVVQGFKSITTNQYIIGVQDQGWPRFKGRL